MYKTDVIFYTNLKSIEIKFKGVLISYSTFNNVTYLENKIL